MGNLDQRYRAYSKRLARDSIGDRKGLGYLKLMFLYVHPTLITPLIGTHEPPSWILDQDLDVGSTVVIVGLFFVPMLFQSSWQDLK